MPLENITIPLAFLAGLLSFLSPCVLPLVPVYIADLAGSTASATNTGYRWKTLVKTLCFVGGFSLVLVLLGAAAGGIGSLLNEHMWVWQKVAGAILIILGLHLTGVLRIPILNYERRFSQPKAANTGFMRSFLMGAAFSAGWTPCVGPVLGSILALSVGSQTAILGALFMFTFSLGMAIPFVTMGLVISKISLYITRITRYGSLVSMLSGLLVIAIGLLILLDLSPLVNSLLGRYLPGLKIGI